MMFPILAAPAVLSRVALRSVLPAATPIVNTQARTIVVSVTKGRNPARALELLQNKMSREGIEKLLLERRVRAVKSHIATRLLCNHNVIRLQRYIKPKYQRQKNSKDAIYGGAKRKRIALVESMLADPHIAPF